MLFRSPRESFERISHAIHATRAPFSVSPKPSRSRTVTPTRLGLNSNSGLPGSLPTSSSPSPTFDRSSKAGVSLPRQLEGRDRFRCPWLKSRDPFLQKVEFYTKIQRSVGLWRARWSLGVIPYYGPWFIIQGESLGGPYRCGGERLTKISKLCSCRSVRILPG